MFKDGYVLVYGFVFIVMMVVNLKIIFNIDVIFVDYYGILLILIYNGC